MKKTILKCLQDLTSDLISVDSNWVVKFSTYFPREYVMGNINSPYKACERGFADIVILFHFRLTRQVIFVLVQLFSFYCV